MKKMKKLIFFPLHNFGFFGKSDFIFDAFYEVTNVIFV